MIAALLHDYLEDIEGSSADELRASFGERVTAMVLGLSDTTSPGAKEDWWLRKRRYIDAMRAHSPDVRLIATADKLHNCRAVLDSVDQEGARAFDRFTTGREGTVWYYRQVANALADGWSHPLLDELLRAVTTLEEVAGPG